jgi:glycosyltransferase involved in cell wall biosynthesis
MSAHELPRLVVPVPSKFWRDDAGAWRTTASHASMQYWRQYAPLFETVLIVGRTRRRGPGSGMPVVAPGVQFLPITAMGGRIGFLFGLASAMRVWRTLRRDDVVFLRVPSIVGSVAVLPHILRGRPLVVHVVGDPESSLSQLLPGWLVRLAVRHTRWLARRGHIVLYVTQQALQQKYPASPGTPTRVKRNILPRDLVLVDKPSETDGPAVLRILTAGSQEQMYKGHDVLLDAVHTCVKAGVRIEAVIVGGGRFHDALVARSVELGLGDRVRFTGQLPSSAHVADELRRADLFVLPSRTEGMPRVLLEAMCLGKPCVASDVGGVAELLPERYLLPPGEVEPLAEAIARAARDRLWLRQAAEDSLNAARRLVSESEEDALEWALKSAVEMATATHE